jgi:hypothetical protein
MSLFIHNKNQELLWSVINKTQLFQLVFAYSKNNEPELWFRAHIQKYYQTIQNINLSIEDLNTCNHEIIAIMLNNLKSFSENVGQQSPPQQQQPYQQPQYQQSNQPTQHQYQYQQTQLPPQSQLPHTVENKQELYSRQFNERQKEYELMNAKPSPPLPDINDNIKDEAISNMDELIKLHMQQREAEMRQFTTLPVAPPPTFENSFRPTNLKIAETNENISLIPDAVISDADKPRKNVSWSDDNLNEKFYQDLHKEFDELKGEVLNITNNFNSFQEEMRTFMTFVINKMQEPPQTPQIPETLQTQISNNNSFIDNTKDFLN